MVIETFFHGREIAWVNWVRTGNDKRCLDPHAAGKF
jgi:hypothetical protein